MGDRLRLVISLAVLGAASRTGSADTKGSIEVLYRRDAGSADTHLAWISPEVQRLGLVTLSGVSSKTYVAFETIEVKTGQSLEHLDGALGEDGSMPDAVLQRTRDPDSCQVRRDGARLKESHDHVFLIQRGGVRRQLDHGVKAAYGPCFVGERQATWRAYRGPNAEYELVVADLV